MSGWLTNSMNLATLPLTGNERFPVDSQLVAGAVPQTEAVSISQLSLGIGGGSVVPWVTGRFYGAAPSTTPVGFLTVTGTLYAYPLFIPATTIKTLNVNVSTPQTGGNAHYGIYADNGAGYPGNLVYDFGAVGALTATGVVTVTSTAAALALNSGLYWIASIFTATSTFPTITGMTAAYTNPLQAQLGFTSATNAAATTAETTTGINVAAAYGALAATFPTGATLTIATATPIAIFGV